jgi:hypothetical protein
VRRVRPTIDQAVDVALGELPIELRPLVGMDLPAYTLASEVYGVATSSKGASQSVAARGVLSGSQCWGTGEPVQDRW